MCGDLMSFVTALNVPFIEAIANVYLRIRPIVKILPRQIISFLLILF